MYVVARMQQLQERGGARADLDATSITTSFLTGLFGLLATEMGSRTARDALIDNFVEIVTNGVECR